MKHHPSIPHRFTFGMRLSRKINGTENPAGLEGQTWELKGRHEERKRKRGLLRIMRKGRPKEGVGRVYLDSDALRYGHDHRQGVTQVEGDLIVALDGSVPNPNQGQRFRVPL